MLRVLRRLVSFGDWNRNHPGEPLPGGDVDATFDAIFEGLGDLEQRLLAITRSDGSLQPGLVTSDTLQPLLAEKIAQEVLARVQNQLVQVEIARQEAVSSRLLVEELLAEVSAAAARALSAAERVDEAKGPAIVALEGLLSRANDLVSRSETVSGQIDGLATVLDGSEGGAQAWAEASRLWAEHMPDTLPENSLVWQDISGEHWSARWWANHADNVFGRLTDMYLGAQSDPPTSNLEGGPIMVGCLYYDIEDQQLYVWDGSTWQPLYQPTRAIAYILHYQATAGQTAFDLSTADLSGSSHALAAGEAVIAHVNGVRLVKSSGAVNDFTVAGSVVTLLRALRAGDIATFEVLVNPNTLAPGTVNSYALNDPVGMNGVQTTFALTTRAGTPAVNVTKSEELVVSIDGVLQDPGRMYTGLGGNVIFAQAPAADSKVFMIWHKSN